MGNLRVDFFVVLVNENIAVLKNYNKLVVTITQFEVSALKILNLDVWWNEKRQIYGSISG